jgi:hypothetical protein
VFFSTFFWTPLDIVDGVSLQSVAPEFLNHVNLVIDVPSLGIGQLPFLYCIFVRKNAVDYSCAFSLSLCGTCCVRTQMDRLQFLAAFGINMAKGGHIVQHRRSLMEELLVKHTRKRDSLRAQVINILIELWRVDALPRDHVDRMSRTVELIVKSLLQHVSAIPSLDWKKVVQEACEKFEKPAASRDRSHRSRTPLRTLQSAHGETRRDSREALPRKKDQTAARSKSAAKPGERLALMNTEQRILVGNLVETPRSCAPTLVDHDDRALSPRQLFMSPPLAREASGSQAANWSLVPVGVGPHGPMQNGDQNVGEPITSTQNIQNLQVCQNEPKAFQKFQMQRMKWPPLDPHDILRAQQKAAFTNASADDVMDFVFHCAEDARLDKLYLSFRELSKAGVFVDLLYWGSVHHQLINACGFKGSDAVPAVSTKLGPSINFHISTSGRIRLDGRMEQREILASMLRRAFPPFDPAHLSKMPATPQMQVEGRKHQEWMSQRHGKVLAINAACIFDGFGVNGVWDKLNIAVGARGAASNNAIPWIILTRSHVCVAVWPSGKVQISPGFHVVAEQVLLGDHS